MNQPEFSSRKQGVPSPSAAPAWSFRSHDVGKDGGQCEKPAAGVCAQMFGRMYAMMGYTDCEEFNAILKITNSSWLEVARSGENDLVMMEGNKL